MPLLDHFHPPLSLRRGWEGFHGLWASELVGYLNGGVLGDEYYADMQINIGSAVEVDVATLADRDVSEDGSAVATRAAPRRSVATAALEMPIVFPDDNEVRVYSTSGGLALVAAVELVSPGNKDRPETRRAFAAKCVAYLSRGIGLVVVDVVTNRLANLHDEVVGMLGLAEPYSFEFPPPTYATAYRPRRRPDGDRVELWREALAIGEALPILPLALRNAETVPLDLESTYLEACRRQKIA